MSFVTGCQVGTRDPVGSGDGLFLSHRSVGCFCSQDKKGKPRTFVGRRRRRRR